MTDKPIAYDVTHKATGKVTRYKTLTAAMRAADKADNAYGCYITSRRAVWSAA
jgi:hypothetical protein